ncbi:MAG: hypothetical protein ACOC0U_02265, partial [Desulfovibrionales bacterium]
IGMRRIKKRVLFLQDLFARELERMGHAILSPRGEGERSGIQIFDPGSDPEELRFRLGNHGVMVSARGGGIRVAPHFYNSEEEAERFCSVLDRLL